MFIVNEPFLFTTYHVYHILFFLFATLTFGAFGFTMTLAVEWHLWKCNLSLIVKPNTPLVYPVGAIICFGFIIFVSTPKPEAMVVCLPTNLTCISWYIGNSSRSLRFPHSAMPFGRWHCKFSFWSGWLGFYIVNWRRLDFVTRARGLVAMNLTLRPSWFKC